MQILPVVLRHFTFAATPIASSKARTVPVDGPVTPRRVDRSLQLETTSNRMNAHSRTRRTRRVLQATPRVFNAVLAVWLLASSVLWPHAQAQRLSTMGSGAVVLLLEWLSRKVEWAHRLSGLVATWVILALFVIWPSPITAWNNLLVGLIMAVLSTLDPDRPFVRRRRA